MRNKRFRWNENVGFNLRNNLNRFFFLALRRHCVLRSDECLWIKGEALTKSDSRAARNQLKFFVVMQRHQTGAYVR